MRKFLILFSSVLILSACSLDSLRNETDTVIQDGKESYQKIADEAQEIQQTILTTKNKIDETVADIENALQKIEEAKEALKEVTE